MSEPDLSKAIEGGADSGFDRGNDSRREISERIITAAVPHILDAYAASALAAVDRREWGSLGNVTVARWLRAEAARLRGGA